MIKEGNTIAKISGGVIGLALSGFLMFYLPMKANYEQNGCIWLECKEALNAE